ILAIGESAADPGPALHDHSMAMGAERGGAGRGQRYAPFVGLDFSGNSDKHPHFLRRLMMTMRPCTNHPDRTALQQRSKPEESTAFLRALSSRVSQENCISMDILCSTIWNLTRRLAPRLMSMIPIAYRERDARRSHGDPTGAQVFKRA